MQIKISSKHMDITPAIEQYAVRKVEKLSRFYDRIQQIDVVIDKAKNGYTIEIITDVEHHEPFIASGDHDDLYAGIDLGVDRSIRQLKDHKSRVRDHKHNTPTGGASAEAAAVSDRGSDLAPDLTSNSAPPLTPAAAPKSAKPSKGRGTGKRP